MSRIYYIIAIICLFYTNGILAQAQANLLVDSTIFLIGDPLYIKVVVNVPKGNKATFPNMQAILEKEELEVVKVSEIEEKVGQTNITYQQQIEITAWEPKRYYIPEISFNYGRDGYTDEVKSGKLMLTAHTPLVTGDSTYIADIKPLWAEEANFLDLLIAFLRHPVVVALSLIAFFGGIIYLIIRRSRLKNLEANYISPEQRIIQRLEILKANNPLARGEFQAYHTQISFLLREYINGRFQTKALEAPVSQFLPQIKGHKYMPSNLYTELQTVLEHADLIKFAKASPLDIANKKAMELSYNLVEAVQDKLYAEADLEAANS